MNIFGLEIPRDILVTAIVAVALTVLLVSWLYEHDMSVMRRKHALLEDAMLDRTYDWLVARAERNYWQTEAFSFSNALHRHLDTRPKSMDEHLATLFDEELMKGNQD